MGAKVPIQEQGQVARFLQPHLDVDPPRYARLRAGRSRRAADSIWRRDLKLGDNCAQLAVEVVERHAGIGAKDKAWLEIVEKGGRFPIVDTLPLGSPPEGAESDDDADGEIGKGEIIGALVTAVLGSNRQMADECISLRQALATKDDQLLGLVGKHTELAMQAAKDGVLLRLHEEGIFQAPSANDGLLDRVQALLPVIERVSPHIAAAYAAHRAASVRAVDPAAPLSPADRVDLALGEVEAIAADVELSRLVLEPVRFARLQSAAAKIMQAAS